MRIRVRRLASNLLSIIISLAVCLAIAEAGLRVVFHQSMDFDIEMWKYATEIKRQSENPAIAHEHRPNSQAFLMGADVQINSLKLREDEIPFEKPADTKRILMLGDSLTFGWGVTQEDTTSEILQALIDRESTGKVQVINTGVGNYNTSMETGYFFEDGRKFDPDVIVLNYFINDAEVTPRKKGWSLLNASYLYVFVKGRYDVFTRTFLGGENWQEYYQNLYGDDKEGWNASKESILKLGEYASQNGIRFVVAHYPELHELEQYPFGDVTRKVAEVANQAGAVFVDLTPTVSGFDPESLWVSPEDAHPNRKANEQYARKLQEIVTPLLD